MEELKSVGRTLLLSDGLSTWIFSSFHSQIIDKETVEKYVRLDKITKKYLMNHIENPSNFILNILCKQMELLWLEVFNAHLQLEIYENINPNLFFDLRERVKTFKNYGVKLDGYITK